MTKSSSQKKKKLKTTPSDPLQETHFEPVKIEIENSHNLLILLKCEDYKVQVQALYHLRKYLSKANSVTVELMIKKDILASLLPLLKNKDLCIRKLSYAILSNLIDHSSVRFTLQDASWTETFLEAFFNRDDPIILENVLKIFSLITEDSIGKSFIAGQIPLEKISACLDIDDPDIKKHTLKTILNYLEDETIKCEGIKLETLVKLIDSEYPVIQQLTLDVLTSMMKRHDGIETQLKFKHLGGFNKLMNYLEKPEYEDIHPRIMEIFGSVTDNEKIEIMEANTLRKLLLLSRKILNVDKLEKLWNTIIRLAHSKRNNQRFILNILASSGTNMEVSVELMREIITCLTILVQNSFYRDRLDPKEYIDHLTRHLLESEDDQLSITILACLSQLVYDDRMCQVLCDGYIQKLWEQLEKNLDKNKVSLAVGQFILIASSAHQSAANAFIRVGLLEWLIGKKKCELIPVWQSVMHRLFENHLSAKFTLYDRLEFTDVIKDRFYAWRLNESKDNMSFNDVFPFYENLHQLSSSTELVTDTNVIYVVNLNPKEGYTSSPKNSVQSRSSNQSFGSGAIGSFSSKRSSSKRVSEEEKISRRKNSSNETSKFALCGDPFMREYVNELNEILKEEEKTANIEEPTTGIGRNVFDIQNQLKILAHFVCNQLSGADNNVPCTKHYFDLHISDLKTEVKSRMLPLGVLRLGLSFERALLFKTLADQMGFPCALQRGNHGHGWVEVALTSFDKAPTHVVDLMHSPGELMRLNTPHAHEYMACPKLITAHPP
ncbi:armadillo repeat-containing protein 3 isoform X4 [Nilaparvata lugens]|uniref:armadillo repeat-containing protein 3 isoform X4 n=1 Tax=Nilaparvata lugens TaxID=108931 RepID=UPI00193DB43F|nr:armadillo repeat-containing protein 3 isoform X4 [Nilaparvata lugens]